MLLKGIHYFCTQINEKMKLKIAGIFISVLLISSCGEYNKVIKNPDSKVRFEYAKMYFEQGKYGRAIDLLEDVVRVTRNTSMGEEAMYILAQSYYKTKDYTSAASYFKSYTTIYPRGEYAELASFYSAYGLYLQSPDTRLDQSDTYKSMQEFQEFMEKYPQSEKKDDAQDALFELQEKLALKELITARLYYNLGDYIIYSFPGGNYLSCVITAQNAISLYPFSKYREEFMYYMFKSKYEMAVQSVEDKKEFRYRDVIDEYYAYTNEFPEGKYIKEIKKMYQEIEKEINKN